MTKYALKEHNCKMFFLWYCIFSLLALILFTYFFLNIRLNNLEQSLQDDVECEDYWLSLVSQKLLTTKDECLDMIDKNENLEILGWFQEGNYCIVNVRLKQKCSEVSND